LWKPTDKPEDIARVMIDALSPSKAERTAREILKGIKEQKSLRAACAGSPSDSTKHTTGT
jgi:hypothetical protein